MKQRAFLFVIFAALSIAGAATVVLPSASAQIQAGPSYVPVGTAASGSSSTAWFHHPSSGRVVACQTIAGGAGSSPNGIQCVATNLP